MKIKITRKHISRVLFQAVTKNDHIYWLAALTQASNMRRAGDWK